MKKNLLIYYVLIICYLPCISVLKGKNFASEFQAARKLEKLCETVRFSGEEQEDQWPKWEDGKLTLLGDNREKIDVHITEVELECECLNKIIIRQIMKLKHLRTLWITFTRVEDTDFPVYELKQLEELTISQGTDLENLLQEEGEDKEHLGKECLFPQRWCESIGASQSIIKLNIPSQSSLIREAAKMKQLRSLELNFSPSEETHLFPLILPLKDCLRELTVWCETPPQEVADVLKQFRSLQALTLECFDRSQNLDGFLNDVKNLQLRYLALSDGEIGEEGEKVLREWESLQEVILPWDFPNERFQALEKIKIPVMLVYYYKDPKTNSIRTDGERKVQMCQKFFKEEQYRPYRIDKDGNYVHWNEIHGGIWMTSH